MIESGDPSGICPVVIARFIWKWRFGESSAGIVARSEKTGLDFRQSVLHETFRFFCGTALPGDEPAGGGP